MQIEQNVRIVTYVLDDDREELELIKPYLERVCGVDFSLHSNVEDFIHAIEEGCHIAVIDHRLNARVNGIEVGRKVLAKAPLCYLMMYSGDDQLQTLIDAMNAGFRAYIDKNDPKYLEILETKVAEQLESIRLRIHFYEKYKNHVR